MNNIKNLMIKVHIDSSILIMGLGRAPTKKNLNQFGLDELGL